MYYNKIQEYMIELINEYGPLLKRQLLIMANSKFSVRMKNIDGYSSQLCQYGSFENGWIGDEEYLGYRGIEPNYDMIRSVDVMNKFLPDIKAHRKSRQPVTIRFVAGVGKHEKDISIIPVKSGEEPVIQSYVKDKYVNAKSEIVIFLIEEKNQIDILDVNCNARFALIDKSGVALYTLE